MSIIAVYWWKLVTEICCFPSLWTEPYMHIHTYVLIMQHKNQKFSMSTCCMLMCVDTSD